MKEAIFFGAVFAITLNWIARVAGKPDNFVRRFSRGGFMRELNERMNSGAKEARQDAAR